MLKIHIKQNTRIKSVLKISPESIRLKYLNDFWGFFEYSNYMDDEYRRIQPKQETKILKNTTKIRNSKY